MIQKTTAALIAIAFLFSASSALAKKGQVKVGYVDLNLILSKLDDGKSAKKKFERAMKRRRKALLAKREELTKLKKELEAMIKKKAKQADMKNKLQDYQKKMQAMQKYYAQSQPILRKTQQKIFGPIFARLSTLVQLVASQNGLTLMLEKTRSGLLYANTKFDYSEQVIKAYSAGKK